MYALFALVTLGGLLGFIIWDRRRIETNVSRRPLATLDEPLRSARTLCRSLLGFAFVAVLMGVVELRNPRSPPFSGRRRLLAQLAYEMFGPAGPALLWFALAIVMAGIARAIWRRVPKKPGDRLFWT